MSKNVIIDCDPGIDDSLAIMLALKAKSINVIAITIVCGNAPTKMGFENAKKILKHMQRLDIPIYQGQAKPLECEYIDALDTHGDDGLGQSYLDLVEGYVQDEDAVTFLSHQLKNQKCSIIAIGPLTNLATLIQKDPEAFSCIDQLISMGGTYKSHGNCSPVAEYNYWCDPHAAKIVYDEMDKLDRKIHMIGLDVTRKIVLTPTLLEYIKRLDQNEGNFIEKITKFYFDFHWHQEGLIGCVINDPLAIAQFIDHDICRGFESHVDIVTDGIAKGQTIVDKYHFYQKKPNAIIYTEVDVKKFYYLFLSTLLDETNEELSLLEDMIHA